MTARNAQLKAISSAPSGKKRAKIYIRVSTREQECGGYSIPAQLTLIYDYARREGIEIVGAPIIEIQSARKTGRPHFDAMVEFFRKEMKKKPENRVDAVLTEKTDRLLRNHSDKETLLKLGVNMHLVKDGLILNSSSSARDIFDFNNDVTNATRYSHNLSEETIKGMGQKAADGLYPSNAPFGYLNMTREDSSKIIVPEPVCGPIVADIFKLYASGRHSLDSVTTVANAELSKAGLRPHLRKSSVAQMLKNPIYYGDFTWNKKTYLGKHEPIISRELYNQVNGIAATKNTHTRYKIQKHEWLFKGMLFCECGCAMVGEIKKSKYIYYHCTGNRGGCINKRKYVPQGEIEKQVVKLLEVVSSTVMPFAEFTRFVKEHQCGAREERKRDLVRLDTEVEKCSNRRHELLMRNLDGKIDDKRFKEVDILLEKSLVDHQQRITALSTDDGTFIETSDRLMELLCNAPKLYKDKPDPQKHRLLSYLLAHCTWREGRLHPTFRPPFDRLIHY